MEVVDATQINTFAHVAQQADVSPSEEPIFVLTGSQLQEIIARAITEAIQPLQDEVLQLKVTVAHQGEEIAALKTTETQDYKANSQDIREIFAAIDEIDQRQRIKPQPLQKDRGEILRALLAVNGGKMLAKKARQQMHMPKNKFSELLAVCAFVTLKPYHLDNRQKVIILKSELVPGN
jgi:hypothetical protein